MKFTILSALTITSGALAAPPSSNKPTPKSPVCIIGAGPSGLTAAHNLEKRNIPTIIFEKQSTVGGKCQAYYEQSGQYHPLGALLFSNATYQLSLPIIEKSGVQAQAIDLLRGSGSDYIYDWKSGDVKESPKPTEAFLKGLKEEVGRYSEIWKDRFEGLRKKGYDNGIPTEFTVSTQQWLHDNGFKALPAIFVRGMVVYGYGDLRQIPILYMMQYFTPDVLLFFVGQHAGYLIDFHAVFSNFTKNHIKSTINLSSVITNIDRSKQNPILTYSIGASNERKTQSCSSLILAFPPTLSNLRNAGLKLSKQEEELFTSVKVEDYYAAAVNVNTPPSAVFSANGHDGTTAAPPDAAGEPVFLIRLQGSKSSVAAVYSWDNSTSPRLSSIQEGKELMMNTISKFNKDPKDDNAKSVELKDEDVRAWKKWDYFPHVGEDELKSGWYGRFAKIQGKEKTYYASGLNGFENVEFAVRAGMEVVERYF